MTTLRAAPRATTLHAASAAGLGQAAGGTETGQAGHRVAELENELRKLRIINAVLMERVEREMDPQVDSAFSRMYQAIALESSVTKRTEALTALTQRLLHEINVRREAESALMEAKAAAERANQSKTSFLAAASHDLNQPLHAARLFLGALAKELPPGPKQELAERIDTALDTMDHLLTALMDISKLDAGFWQADYADVPLQILLKALYREFEPQAAAIGLRLRLVETSAIVRTDRHLLERVLRNFIGNAIRYTKSGRILIGCRRCGGAVRIDVIDTGIGIPKAKWRTIFEEFHQLGNNPRPQEKGVGLGLAIVDRVARLLDAPLDLDSVQGSGSRFSITVPLGCADSVEPAAVATPAAASAADFGTCEVLVIDNDPQVLEGMQSLLHSWNCRVIRAASVGEALDQATLAPDIVIADYHLDGGALGTEAIETLRTRFGPDIPSLLITSDSSARLRAELRAAGHVVLQKPVAPSRLRALMSHLLLR
jgi:signal transduction histidine kinase